MYEPVAETVHVSKCAPRGMIAARGDLSDPSFQQAVSSVLDSDLPGNRQVVASKHGLIVWMSPDELLVTCDYDQTDGVIADLSKALAEQHHLATNVSDARATFAIQGAAWRDVLAKGMPVDFRPQSFGEGQVRRSRLGQVAAAIWMTGVDRVELVCFRSVGDFVEEWLQMAAQDGSLPDHY